ncbi:MAG: helix-turn-helix transcriptional regulator [Vicinamibacterales bacterium]
MLESRQLAELRSHQVDDAVPNRLAVAIRLSGVTQRRIADELGMTEPHLSDIKRGKFKSVSLDTARKLAAYFGCAIEDLFPSREAVA